MAIVKTNIAQHPIAGQGLDGQTTHHHLWPVSFTGNINSGDTAEIARLPVAARLVSMTLKSAMTNSATFTVGTVAAPTLLHASVVLAAGGTDRNISDQGMNYRVDESNYPYLSIIATFGAATTVVAGDALWVNIAYIVDSPTRPTGSTL